MRLNEGLKELGFRNFDETMATRLTTSAKQQVVFRRQLADWMHVRELEFPQGLERVGAGWLCGSSVERVVVPQSVRIFEECAF